MDLPHLIDALATPAAFPYPIESVEVRQTHISAVFLAGALVYKVKKPVKLDFLDFSTLEKRRHFCYEEVRLNRRLASHVYLDVVPVVRKEDSLHFEGRGEVVDWAVKMQRLPDDATLRERLRRGELDVDVIVKLARRIASFHEQARTDERIASFGRHEEVARAMLNIFAQATPQVGMTVSQAVFARVKMQVEEALARLRPVIDSRAARRVPRDCHGDLHLDHIYYFPDQEPPADLVLIDCIEFNERFRFIDPAADMAFPAMDLAFHGRRDLAAKFADAYFQASRDEEGRKLLPLYCCYRATVRGMVEGMELSEKEVSAGERRAALERARAHWLLALAELAKLVEKPCLVLVLGLPGSGKSSLARGLAKKAGFTVLRSDVVRKELAGFSEPDARLPNHFYEGPWNEQTYAECLRRAERLLFEGQRVLVDATFREEHRRRQFMVAAVRWGVPAVLLWCQAPPDTIRRRLQSRHGDASDADWSTYRQLAMTWEDVGTATEVHAISTEASHDGALAQALAVLRRAGLYD
jgi:aminoglycoside phosphotransferase family enzyme/predicted kinase